MRSLLSRVSLTLLLAGLCVRLVAFVPDSAAESARPRVAPTIHASASHAALWQRLYARLPDAWKSDERFLVLEVSDREMARRVGDGQHSDRGNDDDYEVDGYYDRDGDDGEPTIVLRDDLEGEDVSLVFLHEYGHLFWDDKLTRSERSDYRRIWSAARRRDNLVTEYAAESEEEGFAEAFAYFLDRPSTLRRRDPESADFLRRLVDRAKRPAAETASRS